MNVDSGCLIYHQESFSIHSNSYNNTLYYNNFLIFSFMLLSILSLFILMFSRFLMFSCFCRKFSLLSLFKTDQKFCISILYLSFFRLCLEKSIMILIKFLNYFEVKNIIYKSCKKLYLPPKIKMQGFSPIFSVFLSKCLFCSFYK